MPKKILIVEDENAISKALELSLTKSHFKVQSASNGEEALDLIGKNEFDLILLDIMMPKMDGIEMLKKLRDGGKDIPVIILSNHSDPEKLFSALKGKAFDYLVKSDWSAEDIVVKVRERLNV